VTEKQNNNKIHEEHFKEKSNNIKVTLKEHYHYFKQRTSRAYQNEVNKYQSDIKRTTN